MKQHQQQDYKTGRKEVKCGGPKTLGIIQQLNGREVDDLFLLLGVLLQTASLFFV